MVQNVLNSDFNSNFNFWMTNIIEFYISVSIPEFDVFLDILMSNSITINDRTKLDWLLNVIWSSWNQIWHWIQKELDFYQYRYCLKTQMHENRNAPSEIISL